MRTHERYGEYVLLHDVGLARDVVAPERLVAARYEPVMAILPEAMLDLTFERDGRYVTLTGAYVLGSMLELREAPPIVWPQASRLYGSDDLFEALEELVEPWLAELMLAAYANDESVRVFSDDARVRMDLDRARAEGLYGAIPIAEAMRSIGPYVYGYRFVRDARVAVRDAAGANGAAILQGRAKSVAFDGRNDERNAFARRWFAAHRFEALLPSAYDVAFLDGESEALESRVTIHTSAAIDGDREVVLAHPVPAVSLVSLDVEDSIPDRRFGVTTRERVDLRRSIAAAPPITGGSGGRILLLVRDDWKQAEDADTDAVRVLAPWLEREGFTVSLASSGSRLEPTSADVVHVVGHRHIGAALPFLEACAAAGVPIVAAPYADDPRNELPWGGPIQLSAYRNGQDADLVELYADSIASRRLQANGVDATPLQQPVPNPELARLLALSGAAITSGAEEERFLRELYGYRGPVLHAPAYLEPVVAVGAETLAGLDDFALVHAPIDTWASLLFVLAAAARESLPLVWTGPVANHELLHYVRCYASDRTFYIPPSLLSAGELEGLYARARVFVDVGWASRGLNRVARAASYGAEVVGSTQGYAKDVLGESCHAADPASIPSIAAAMRAAWADAPLHRQSTLSRAGIRFDGVAALVSTVTAYGEAAKVPLPVGRKSL